jgi:hypothetical protein
VNRKLVLYKCIYILIITASISLTREEVKLMSKKTYRPGQTAPKSGQYGIVGPRGGSQGREVTVVKGEPFPPTPKPDMGFVLVDQTKHSSK